MEVPAGMRVWFLVLVVMLSLLLGGLEVLASLSASMETSAAGRAATSWR